MGSVSVGGRVQGVEHRINQRIARQRTLPVEATDPTRLAEGRTGGLKRLNGAPSGAPHASATAAGERS